MFPKFQDRYRMTTHAVASHDILDIRLCIYISQNLKTVSTFSGPSVQKCTKTLKMNLHLTISNVKK